MIAIIDYDVGNIAAVANMLRRLGIDNKITCKPQEVESAERIILPGNGAFDACMKNLRASGLIPLLERKVIQQKTPLLGICVGAQMLGFASEEGIEPGLGWLNMRVRKFPKLPGLRVPHMGWTEVRPNNAGHYLTSEMESETRFYFVHSYFMDPECSGDVLMTSDYGFEFPSAVARNNIAGVQFHPEKSHRFGKRLLSAFANGGAK